MISLVTEIVKGVKVGVGSRAIGGTSLFWRNKEIVNTGITGSGLTVSLEGSLLSLMMNSKQDILYPNEIIVHTPTNSFVKSLLLDKDVRDKAKTDKNVARSIYKRDEKEFHRITRLVSSMTYQLEKLYDRLLKKEGFRILI